MSTDFLRWIHTLSVMWQHWRRYFLPFAPCSRAFMVNRFQILCKCVWLTWCISCFFFTCTIHDIRRQNSYFLFFCAHFVSYIIFLWFLASLSLPPSPASSVFPPRRRSVKKINYRIFRDPANGHHALLSESLLAPYDNHYAGLNENLHQADNYGVDICSEVRKVSWWRFIIKGTPSKSGHVTRRAFVCVILLGDGDKKGAMSIAWRWLIGQHKSLTSQGPQQVNENTNKT